MAYLPRFYESVNNKFSNILKNPVFNFFDNGILIN